MVQKGSNTSRMERQVGEEARMGIEKDASGMGFKVPTKEESTNRVASSHSHNNIAVDSRRAHQARRGVKLQLQPTKASESILPSIYTADNKSQRVKKRSRRKGKKMIIERNEYKNSQVSYPFTRPPKA
ncbi:hypothetical protein EYC84_001683 [Monilinia fructicola]|uniref:Uncharacterized protein n=1 Tax=Monilinia fructicola TaxID=38448 RepID=A0A5M9JV91_MONFR|nr:hypothetical protein EYC84_001683 [Monilinia fructicola]